MGWGISRRGVEDVVGVRDEMREVARGVSVFELHGVGGVIGIGDVYDRDNE